MQQKTALEEAALLHSSQETSSLVKSPCLPAKTQENYPSKKMTKTIHQHAYGS